MPENSSANPSASVTDSADAQRRLRLYARRDGSGEVHGTFLIRDGNVVALWEESGLGEELALSLPAGALEAIFRRYGKPLEPGVTPTPVVRPDDDDQPLVVPLRDGGQARLWRFQFMPYGWVHPADYLLWECPWPARPGAATENTGAAARREAAESEDASRTAGEPLAAPAPLVVSALSALCRAAAG